MATFLRMYSRSKLVYDVALNGGAVSVVTGPPAALAAVDRIELFDPAAQPGVAPQYVFSVFPDSLAAPPNGTPLWRQITFKTRCFLMSASEGTNLAQVQLKLQLQNAQIKVTDFSIFGEFPTTTSPAFPTTIPNLSQFSFVHHAPFQWTPVPIVAKLGISGYWVFGWNDPQILCRPAVTGIQFEVGIPLDPDIELQTFIPYGIQFPPNNTELPPSAGGRRMVLFQQIAAKQAAADPPFWILIATLPSSIVADSWNNSIAVPFLRSLNMVRSGLPASFVPTIARDPGQTAQFSVSFALVDQNAPAAIALEQCVLRDPQSQLVNKALNIVSRTVQLADPAGLHCTANFPNLLRSDGNPVQINCLLTPPSDHSPTVDVIVEASAGYCFNFQHLTNTFTTASSQLSVRMGALELFFPGLSATAANNLGRTGPVRASLRTIRQKNDDVPAAHPLVRIDFLDISLGVTALGVGGQDAVPGSEYAPPNQPFLRTAAAVATRRAPSVQIAIDNFPSINDFFVLNVTETCYELTSQTLSLRIEQQRLSAATGGKADLNLLVIDPEPFFVARVSVPDYQQSLRDALTDQIASWNNNAADAGWQISAGTEAFQMTLPPQGVTDAMHKSKNLAEPDVTPGIPVDFRFTPPALINLRSSATPTRFVQVPWNLRRILGYPQQSGAKGAVIESASFELLYGLSANLDAKPGTQLAEIGALLGNFAAAPDAEISWQHSAGQETSYESYIDAWADLYPQLRTRVAALQPSSATLTQADNLTFHLRKGADLAYPTVPGTPPVNIPQGNFEGSFAWAFDSDRIYQALWANPDSVSAELDGLAFSSLGGWGQFTARFAQGKTSIIAAVRMGRIQTLTIELIGRIGNFWNRAKLVTTYERTVAPTEQFSNQQYPLLGNPVLRKTAEYVQILEKRRDATGADATGPYSACEFPDGDPPKIPVDSASWGENAGATGYKVPLWKPGAQPATVYKKPTVRLHLKSALSDGTTPQNITDPEKLCFYTDTDSTLSSDTDTWPKQAGVDFGYVTKDLVQGTDTSGLSNLAGGRAENFKRKEEPWIQPGLGQFTYSLDPGPAAANVTAGVSDQAIGAALRTITIMRGLDGSAVLEAGDAYAQSLQIPDYVSNILRPVISLIPVSATASDLAAKWTAWQIRATDAATACAAALGNLPAQNATNLCSAVEGQIKGKLNVLKAQVENEVAGLLTEAHDLLNAQPAVLSVWQQQWKTLYGVIQGQLRFTKSQIGALAATILAKTNSAFAGVNQALKDLDTELGQLEGQQQGAIQKAITAVQSAADHLDSILGEADGLIEGLLGPISGGYLDNLRPLISNLRDTIHTASTDAIDKLKAGGDNTVITTVRADLANLTGISNTAQMNLTIGINKIQTAAAGLVSTTLETTLETLDAAVGAANDWPTFIASASQKLSTFSTGLKATVDQHLSDLNNHVTAYAAVACQQILNSDLTGILAKLKDAVDTQSIQKFFDGLQAVAASGRDAIDAAEGYLHGLQSQADQYLKTLALTPRLPPLPAKLADPVLFLLRGFGDIPKVPQLDFNVPFTAYRFAQLGQSLLPDVLPNINLSPLAAFANQFSAGGNPINLTVPTFELGDNILPFNLSNFDLSSVLPHIAGLDLSHLFQGLRFDDDQGKNIVVKHGEDLQSRSAWVEIDVNATLAKDAEVFSYFGLTVLLKTANFQASTRVQGQAGQAVTRTLSGALKGDWSLSAGGFEVVVLENCTLSFDQSGHFGFDVTPAKVKLQAALAFLSELIADFFSGDGFTTSVTEAGVQTVLDLPLPDIQSGTFGIANLRLLCHFGLTFAPFQIRTGVGLASQQKPFTLTIFILGGAGYLELDATYTPGNNRISTTLEVGIFASASLAISLGPISGGVYAYFGITVSYHAETGTAPDLRISLVLMFSGQVSLLGFISVSLSLSLSATYDSTSHVLIGRGSISFSIKISFFFTINVHSEVNYKFSNAPAAAQLDPPTPADYEAAASEYLAMFYN